MQLQLLITASAGTLSRILAICAEDGASVEAPNAPTISTPGPGPASPPIPSVPTPPVAASGDDDESNDTAPTGTLDKDGLPHDARIHSEPAKLTGKGVWRKRRGVDDATVAAVEAELKANTPVPGVPAAPITPPAPPPAPVMAAPIPAPAAPAPLAPALPPLPAPADVSQVPPVAVPVPAAPAPQPAPPPPPPASGPMDFTGFMAHVASKFGVADPATGAMMIDTDYLLQRVQEMNTAWAGQPGFTPLTVITDIANAGPLQPQLVEYAKSLLTRDGKW